MDLDLTGLSATAVFIIVILREVFNFVQSKRNGKDHISDELRTILKELDHKMDQILKEAGDAGKLQQIHFAATSNCPGALTELSKYCERITAHQEAIAKALERLERLRAQPT